MAFMLVHGHCYTCDAFISFNPHRVPSLPGHLTKSGTREPVCRSCIEETAPDRKKNGLPPIVIHPDAYEPEEVL
jgi:hypothetical protein